MGRKSSQLGGERNDEFEIAKDPKRKLLSVGLILEPFWNVKTDTGHSYRCKMQDHAQNSTSTSDIGYVWICYQKITMVFVFLNFLRILECSEQFLLDLLGTEVSLSRSVRLMSQRLTWGPQFAETRAVGNVHICTRTNAHAHGALYMHWYMFTYI